MGLIKFLKTRETGDLYGRKAAYEPQISGSERKAEPYKDVRKAESEPSSSVSVDPNDRRTSLERIVDQTNPHSRDYIPVASSFFIKNPKHLQYIDPKFINMVKIPANYEMIKFKFGGAKKLRSNESRKPKGPGLRLVFGLGGIYASGRIVSKRIDTVHLSKEEVGEIVSKDSAQLKVSAYYTYHIVDSNKALVDNENYAERLNAIVRARLREVTSQHTAEELFNDKDLHKAENLAPDPIKNFEGYKLNDIGIIIDELGFKSIDIPEDLEKKFSVASTARFQRQADIIDSEADVIVARNRLEEAKILATIPEAMELRKIEALTTIAKEGKGTTILGTDLSGLAAGIFAKKESRIVPGSKYSN